MLQGVLRSMLGEFIAGFTTYLGTHGTNSLAEGMCLLHGLTRLNILSTPSFM